MKISFELKIALIFLVTGFFWILFSSEAVSLMAHDPAAIIQIEKYKGWFYVLLMTVLLYILIRREVNLQKFLYNKLEASQKKLIDQNKKLREYAFVTSHHLRKPLANILALVQLFNPNDISDPNNRVAIENIKLSSEDLDKVIRRTNELIDDSSEVMD